MILDELMVLTKELTVLVAEDDVVARHFMDKLFSRLFKEIVLVEDGLEAFRAYSKNPKRFDLIITDITMPHLEGEPFLRKIRQTDYDIPIIMISSLNDSARLISLLNSGADGFLEKPFNMDQFIPVLGRICRMIFDRKELQNYRYQLETVNSELIKRNEELERMHRIAKAQAVVAAVVATQNSHEHQESSNTKQNYFQTLDFEHIHELEELISDLEGYILLSFQNNYISEQYIIEIIERFQKFGNILFCYPIFFSLADEIVRLARVIRENKEFIIEKPRLVFPFMENLVYVLDQYINDVWKRPAKNPLFYNATLLSDIATFIGFLGADDKETSEEDFIEFF